MNLKYLALGTTILTLFSLSVQAEQLTSAVETTNEAESIQVEKKSELRANLRRLGLEVSSTTVKNAKEYQDSPVSQLNADSQTLIRGVFDFVLEYETDMSRWDNSVFMNYGKTKIKAYNEVSETTENEDKILLTSDYTYKVFKFQNIDLGPFASIAYQTEFTRNEDAPRMKVFRGKTGMKLLNGKIIKDLYIAGVGEYDMTYSENVSKLAGEIGWRLEDTLRDGVKLSTDGYFRKYFSYSHYIGSDLKHDLSLTARMDVDVTDTLTFGPYLSYRLAKSREAEKHGSNLMIGLSISYKNLLNLW